jgi:UDP-GlcNAc:undecaprenyl-phosphate GlcNAc-1-phosphate transferase
VLNSSILWSCGEAFALAGLVTALLTPVVGRVAIRYGVIDKPNHRKVHVRIIPRMGGVAVFAGIVLALSLLHMISPATRALIDDNLKSVVCLAGGATVLFIVGIVDDIREVSPRLKIICQAIAGVLAFFGGFQFLLFRGFFPGAVAGVGSGSIGLAISLVLTVFWTIGTTNAVNLIDGLDGLASGITGIAFTLLGVISIRNGRTAAALLAFVSAGAACGFLWHNRHPAKIFLGDTGSLLLGFMLSALSINGTQQGSWVASMAGPLCLLYIPLLDTVLAIVRRGQKGLPFSFADKYHIHHRLLQRGISHSRVVLILWGVSLGVGCMALMLHLVVNAYRALAVNLFAIIVMAVIISIFGNSELQQSVRSVRIINRRKLTPRRQVLSLRRALVGLDKRTTAESLVRQITGLADKFEMDSVEISLGSDSRPEGRFDVLRWDRHSHESDASEAWRLEPPRIVKVSASFPCSNKKDDKVVVELGRAEWKFRRKSEDLQLWANLIAEKLGPLPVLKALSESAIQAAAASRFSMKELR